MATKEKDDVSAPIAVLLMFLAFALAAGGIGNLGGGGDGGGGDGHAEDKDPCDGKDPDTVVRSWTVNGRTIYLRCGKHRDPQWGWRHLRDKNLDDWGKVLDCVGRVLDEGDYSRGRPGAGSGEVRDMWKLRLAGQRNPTSVIVSVDPGNVLTVFVNSRTWTRCAEGALR